MIPFPKALQDLIDAYRSFGMPIDEMLDELELAAEKLETRRFTDERSQRTAHR